MHLIPHLLAITISIMVLVSIFMLMRQRHIREKYAAIWIVVGMASFIGSIWANLLSDLSRTLGFGIPSNFLFFVDGIVLLLISIQLSVEVSKLEFKVERLVEEITLIREDLRAADE